MSIEDTFPRFKTTSHTFTTDVNYNATPEEAMALIAERLKEDMNVVYISWSSISTQSMNMTYEPPQYVIDERTKRLRMENAARRKSRKLLRMFLTEEQNRTLDTENYFEFSVGKRGFRINNGQIFNIEVYMDNEFMYDVCYVPDVIHDDADELPEFDIMLAQMLSIKSNTRRFLRLANVA